jgi:hypothetical protein
MQYLMHWFESVILKKRKNTKQEGEREKNKKFWKGKKETRPV